MIKKFIPINMIILSLLYSCNPNSGKQNEHFDIGDTAGISNRASYLYYQRKFEEAKRTFDTLIFIEPMQGEWYYKRAYSSTFLPYDYNSVFADYRNAIALEYRKGEAMHNIGVIFHVSKNYDSAVYYYNQALEINPGDTNTIKRLDDIRRETKNFE